MEHYTPEILISDDEIAARIEALGNQITKDFENQEVVVICVLKGSYVFCADLIRKIQLPLRLEFVACSSYGESMSSSGNVHIDLDVTGSIENQNVIIVEDIVDTGLTIKTLLETFKLRRPKSLKLASLLYKPSRLKYSIDIDYLAFEIEDKFVIGYGLDYAGRYRELPYIGILNAGH
ncbi:MAG: hypoxanthine phosphoribosyltransferase [Bacteriovoracaceae bacterium]|nr:hypoxanthine phosphoribosyltransferase [Bacteriovoracaceae bacterium]